MAQNRARVQPVMAGGKGRSESIERNPSILGMRTKSELVDYVDSLFAQEGSAQQLGVDAAKLRALIERVSRHYRQNPYHNFHHAADTVNTVGWMITRPVLRVKLPVYRRFLLMLTALIHDIEHPGHNNQWEVQTQSPLAKKYDNEAVLEKHSYKVTVEILADPAYDLFLPFGKKKAQAWLKIIEQLVLATDFALHQQFMDEFRAYLANRSHDFSDPVFLGWIERALLKAADIANTSKPFPEAMVWGRRVMMEFWSQGVLEKKRNLPVGPLNDPETVKLNAAQAGFIRFAAMELFQLLSEVEPGLEEMVENLRTNLELYEEKARRGDGLFE